MSGVGCKNARRTKTPIAAYNANRQRREFIRFHFAGPGGWVAVQEVKEDARVVAERASDAVAKGALRGFFAPVLAAIAAATGGATGCPRTAPAQPL